MSWYPGKDQDDLRAMLNPNSPDYLEKCKRCRISPEESAESKRRRFEDKYLADSVRPKAGDYEYDNFHAFGYDPYEG
jgi:hypothetical protein